MIKGGKPLCLSSSMYLMTSIIFQ